VWREYELGKSLKLIVKQAQKVVKIYAGDLRQRTCAAIQDNDEAAELPAGLGQVLPVQMPFTYNVPMNRMHDQAVRPGV
jgi:hypothetical protein